jgi:hypothetical protein
MAAPPSSKMPRSRRPGEAFLGQVQALEVDEDAPTIPVPDGGQGYSDLEMLLRPADEVQPEDDLADGPVDRRRGLGWISLGAAAVGALLVCTLGAAAALAGAGVTLAGRRGAAPIEEAEALEPAPAAVDLATVQPSAVDELVPAAPRGASASGSVPAADGPVAGTVHRVLLEEPIAITSGASPPSPARDRPEEANVRIGRGRGGVATPGELSERDVRRVVRRQQSRLRQCFVLANRRSGQPQDARGRLHLQIDPAGHVEGVVYDGDDFGHLGRCLERVAARWSFPPSRTGAEVPLPIHFAAIGG